MKTTKLKYYMGRGLLHPEQLQLQLQLHRHRHRCTTPRHCRNKILCLPAHCTLHTAQRDIEVPIRKQWMEDSILQPDRASVPKFTAKGKRFVKWTYPLDLNELLEGK